MGSRGATANNRKKSNLFSRRQPNELGVAKTISEANKAEIRKIVNNPNTSAETKQRLRQLL